MRRFAPLESLMARETRQAPDVVAQLLWQERQQVSQIGRRFRDLAPPVILTCGRGSSDHAAAYFKYAVEIMLGVPVASMGPSIASLYKTPLRLENAVLVTISQSGKSPDILALQKAAKDAGALTIALVNAEDSALAASADLVIPLHCGPENSVAATKTLIASCAALAAIAAEWSSDPALKRAVDALPDSLATALEQDWSIAEPISLASSGYMIGRGPSFPIAQEAALKLKETASLHMEAFSAAEVMHGPRQLVTAGFPVLAFVQDDAAARSSQDTIDHLMASGADVYTASPLPMSGKQLAMKSTGHGIIDPIAMIQSFYLLAERLAQLRGLNPDQPSHLRKVTETI
jgi:glutamine---fructose-6-phosphate transaminase (isomerizing)